MAGVRIAAALLVFSSACLAQAPQNVRYLTPAAYPEQEAAAVWRSLGATYVKKALQDNQLDRDPRLNARLDAIIGVIGTAAGIVNPRYAGAPWRVLPIDDFGHGAVAFPGGTVLVDSGFVRRLELSDAELALLLAHEVAHVMAGHPLEKLSFMADRLGKERAPTAGSALVAFYSQDGYARQFLPTARLQEREADAIGATILAVSGYEPAAALAMFDKLAAVEGNATAETSTHDGAAARKRAMADVLRGLKTLSVP